MIIDIQQHPNRLNKNLPDGQNMGGLIQEVNFGFHADVLIWPTKPLNPLTLEASATLTGELVMDTRKHRYCPDH